MNLQGSAIGQLARQQGQGPRDHSSTPVSVGGWAPCGHGVATRAWSLFCSLPTHVGICALWPCPFSLLSCCLSLLKLC